MTDGDLFGFTAVCKRLGAVFQKRTDTEEFKALTSSYFRALYRHELRDLERAADGWIERQKQFPKPFEWAGAVVHRPVNVARFSQEEAQEYHRAERLRWEDAPCHCSACLSAGVSDKPLRFVPEFTGDDREQQVFDADRNRMVTAGHWAHGDELARWYVSRANFWNAYYVLIRKPRVSHSELTQVGR